MLEVVQLQLNHPCHLLLLQAVKVLLPFSFHLVVEVLIIALASERYQPAQIESHQIQRSESFAGYPQCQWWWMLFLLEGASGSNQVIQRNRAIGRCSQNVRRGRTWYLTKASNAAGSPFHSGTVSLPCSGMAPPEVAKGHQVALVTIQLVKTHAQQKGTNQQAAASISAG